jgi:predicted ATPase
VERALQFVLDLRAATHIALRAGVTTNLAYAGFVGGAQREEYTCHSTHVNVAARQMVLAGWGEIWLDAETARVAAGHFELAPHGHHQFKGFAAPQAAFRLLSRRVFSPETFYQYAFVGRRRELAQLQAALAPIFAGRCGGIVTILGEAGIGKSRLVHELRLRYNAPVAPQWFLGQTDELLRRSLNPFRYWLRDYCGQASDAGDAENKRAFTASLDRLVAALRAAPSHVQALGLVVEIERTRSCLGALLDLHWTDSFYARLEPRLRFANTLDALRALILAESLCKPLVLQVEDAHWLDPDSRSLVQRLVEQADEFPFVVVLTARPAAEVSGASGERAAWLGHEADQTQIALEMLTHDDLTVMAEQFLGGPVTDELVRLVHQRAGGNPLFAEQLLLYLSEQGLVEQSGAEWRVSRGAEYATLLPSDARAVLTARIDRLNPMVKAVVQTAAVLGREFAVVLLARMLDDQQELPARLRAAEEAAIWSALDQVRYLFKHALLRDAAYEMQLRVRLRELHRLAAGSIEQLYAHDLVPHYAALAYHTEQAGQTAAAVQWYLLAGEQSSAQYANQDALEAFDRALVLLSHDQSQGRARALLGRVNVYSLLAERAAEQRDLAALQALLDEHDDATLQLNVAVRQLIYFNVVCDYNGARALAPDVVHLAQMVGDVHSEAECYYHWAMAHTGLHDYAAAAACHTAAHALAQQHGHRRIEARALIGLGVISTEQAEYLRAQVYYAEALPIARLLNDTWIEGIILGNSSILMWHLGDVDACERYMLESMRLEQMIGFRRGDAISYKYLALVALARYDLAQARSVSQQALQISRDILDREVEAELLEQLGIICCYESDYDAATSYFEQARAIFHDVGQLVREGLALQNLGAVTQALGQYAVAQRQLEHALALVRSMQNRLFESNVLVSLCVLYYAQGDDAWVVEYGHQAVALGHTVHNRVAIMSALAFQGHALARLNRLDEARVVYQQALASKQEWWGAAAPVLLALTGYLHAVTGMAELALLHKEQVQAKQFAEEVLTYLPDTPLDLRLQPQHILLTCCRVLAALNDFPHIGADCADAGAD